MVSHRDQRLNMFTKIDGTLRREGIQESGDDSTLLSLVLGIYSPTIPGPDFHRV